MHLGAFCAANAPDRERERETYRPGPDSTRTAQQLVLALTNSTVRACKK